LGPDRHCGRPSKEQPQRGCQQEPASLACDTRGGERSKQRRDCDDSCVGVWGADPKRCGNSGDDFGRWIGSRHGSHRYDRHHDGCRGARHVDIYARGRHRSRSIVGAYFGFRVRTRLDLGCPCAPVFTSCLLGCRCAPLLAARLLTGRRECIDTRHGIAWRRCLTRHFLTLSHRLRGLAPDDSLTRDRQLGCLTSNDVLRRTRLSIRSGIDVHRTINRRG
jgi:hypothetical protein